MISYPPGVMPETFLPGDLLVTHSSGFLDKMIRLGEKMRGSGQYAWASHVVCVGYGHLIEALGQGVVTSPLDKYKDCLFSIIDTELDEADRKRAVDFWSSAVGDKYGFITDVSLGIYCLTNTKLGILREGSYICSGLAASGLVEGGVHFPKFPELCLPSDIMKFYKKEN
jgi:hypothetical protein